MNHYTGIDSPVRHQTMPLSYSGDQFVRIGAPNYSNPMHCHSADNSALAAVLRATTPEVLRAASTHEAVVIGAGAAGGLAALLLTEAGLRVLVLEAGSARTPVDSPLPAAVQGSDPRRQPIQSRCYAWRFAPTAFVDDIDCPYSTP